MGNKKYYEPELGQAVFGQPWREYEASNLLIAALESIREELDRVMGNIFQKEYLSPFGNTGNYFYCPTFEVEAYSWNEDYKQEYNFKWKNIEVSWYKYLGRGTSVNRKVSPKEIGDMLNDCLDALLKYEKEHDIDY